MDEIGNFKNWINIRDINSSFIKKNVFSFLSEKQLLNLIKYNKLIQNLLSVDITNYKKISFKYKIGEKNGKGKEYLIESNCLIFEGEYLNGKRNGEGKEYNKYGELIFEGIYLNGKKVKGKEYNDCGQLIFEGEYLNEERLNGKAKEYNFFGELIFKGDILNGRRWNGKIKEYNFSNPTIIIPPSTQNAAGVKIL